MHKSPEITRLIHENFWIVLSFALAQPVATKLLETKFRGEWKYLRKSIYELAEIRADRALLEMATQLRVLDDQEKLSDYFKQVGSPPFGTVTQGDGTTTDLYFRDMTNKIIHASAFEWKLDDPDAPLVVCHSLDGDRWKSAEIKLIELMTLMGQLMF